MKITWLGQAGLLLERDGVSIMIDPYLSDSVVKYEPKNARRVPVDERFLQITPDVMIFTHDHLDHYDPETAPLFLERTSHRMTVLSPLSVWKKARTVGTAHNCVMFNRHTVWSEFGFRFTAIPAAHSDLDAIGVLIEDLIEEKTYYITGDTLYHTEIFQFLPKEIDLLFLPINGVGNNMNATDAARFAARVGAKVVVPYHFGMFDSIDPTVFACENRILPQIWKEMNEWRN